MTSQLNGTKTGKLAAPDWGGWQPIHIGGLDTADTQPTTEPAPAPEPAFDPVKLAEADRIRALAEADARALEIKAQAEAEAEKIRATEETRRLRLANDKAERRAREEDAASEARIAESNRKRAEADRARTQAEEADAKQEKAEAAAAKEVKEADDKWRAYAIRFAIVCGIVSLPVQMSFFWNPRAPWMAAAPIMLEGAAWVVHRGARAAVANRRPVWHYRTIVWLLAFMAAGINLYHGLHAFDPGTALATAFASVAGPGVWDLHEHGRIRARDGKLSRRQRNEAKKAAKQAAAEHAAAQAREETEQKAAQEAAEAARKTLAEKREKEFPKVWAHALKLAAALGETTVTEAVWRRAHFDIEGTEPGDSVDIIRGRNAASRRVAAAVSEAPGNTPSKVTNAQRASQIPVPARSRVYKPPVRPGRRTKGDTPQYVDAARRQASITAKNAVRDGRRED